MQLIGFDAQHSCIIVYPSTGVMFVGVIHRQTGI